MTRFIVIVLVLWSAQCVNGQNFLRTYGEPGRNERGLTLLRTSSGMQFLGGAVNDSALVQRIDADGNVIWARRFKPAGQYPKRVFDLKEAPDGSIIGCGVGIGPPPAVMYEGFYFRLDEDGNFMWLRGWTDPLMYTKVVLPLSNNEYLLFNCHYDMGASTFADIVTSRVDAATGDLNWVSPRTDLYNQVPYIDDVSSATSLGSAHYLAGRVFTNGSPVSTCRVNLSKFDGGGTHEWTKYLIYQNSMNRRMYGSDIVASNDSLTISWSGDIAGASANYAVGLIRTDTLGNVAWAKCYNFQGSIQELSHKVIATPFGYVMSGQFNGSLGSRLFLLAANHNGDILWVKQYGPSTAVQSMVNSYTKNLVLTPDGYLFTGDVTQGGDANILVVHTDLDGDIPCSTVQEITVVTTVLPTLNFDVITAQNTIPFELSTVPVVPSSTQIADACQVDPFLGNDTTVCSTFVLDASLPGASYEWQDGSSSSSLFVETAGVYWVRVTQDCCSRTDTIEVEWGGSLSVDLGLDTVLCVGSSLLLEVDSTFQNIQWQDGSNDATYEVTESGVYQVTFSSSACAGQGSITVSFIEPPMVDLGPDQVVCESDTPELGTGLVGLPHIWQDGSTGETLMATSSGPYWVEVGLAGCSATDTVTVDVIPLPMVELGPDTLLCSGNELVLEVSVGPAAATWQDGSTAPTMSVGTPGTYWVVLDDQGCLASDTIAIGIIDPPIVDLGPDITVCEGEPTTVVTDLPGVPHIWQDGSTGESFMPLGSGTYWVEVGLQGCSASDSIEVVVIPLPAVDLGPDTILCSGLPYVLSVFVGTSDILWQDGSDVEVYEVDSTGTYWVIVDVQGCIVSDTVVVEFLDIPIVDLGPDTTVCSGLVIDLVTGLAGVPHTWQDGSTDESYAAGSSGTYWVSVGQAGCLSTDTVLVDHIPTPFVDLGPDTVLCAGSELILEVDVGAATIVWQDGSSSGEYWINEAGTYWTTMDLLGCTAYDTITVDLFDPPVFDLGPDVAICTGEVMDFATGLQGLPHLWQDGTTAEVLSASASGIYWVVVGVSGCIGIDTVDVEVVPMPVVDLGVDTVLCVGTELVLTSGYPALNSTWQDGTQATSFTISGPGQYGVEVDIQGCSASDSIVVAVDPLPTLTLPGDTLLCDAAAVMLEASATPDADVIWQDGTVGTSYLAQDAGVFTASVGNACGTVSDSVQVSVAAPFLVPERYLVCFGDLASIDWSEDVASVTWGNGSYELVQQLPEGGYTYTALDIYGCAREGEVLVYSDPEADGISYVPNVFTPNGDGLNEVFEVVGGERAGFSMEIFNRWGELLFGTNDPDQGWNGKYNGGDAPDGTYVYVVRHSATCGERGSVNTIGHVTLLR